MQINKSKCPADMAGQFPLSSYDYHIEEDVLKSPKIPDKEMEKPSRSPLLQKIVISIH
jgi:hypothetical protein